MGTMDGLESDPTQSEKIAEYFDPEGLEEQIRTTFASSAPRPCPTCYRRWFRYESVDQVLAKLAID